MKIWTINCKRSSSNIAQPIIDCLLTISDKICTLLTIFGTRFKIIPFVTGGVLASLKYSKPRYILENISSYALNHNIRYFL